MSNLKKIIWFPTAKSVSLVIYFFFFGANLILIIMTLCLSINAIPLTLIIVFLLCVLFGYIGRSGYPSFIKSDKGYIKLYYFFNHKKMECSEVKISYTDLLWLFGVRGPGGRIIITKHSFPPKIYPAFVLYTEKKFVDKYYLTESLKTIEELQRYADYSWPTVLEKEFIVIDGSYKNYKYLRQFFGVDKFCDTRGIEENKIAEYEEKLGQETLSAANKSR